MIEVIVRGPPGSGKSEFIQLLTDSLIFDGWHLIVEDDGSRWEEGIGPQSAHIKTEQTEK